MNRVMVGVICGIVWGLVDVGITAFGNHPEASTGMYLQAFSSRFAIGLLAATVKLPLHPVAAGAAVGLLISLPDAFALKAYAGILGTGLVFGAATGWVVNKWGAPNP